MFLKLDDAELFLSSFGKGPDTLVAHGGWVGDQRGVQRSH